MYVKKKNEGDASKYRVFVFFRKFHFFPEFWFFSGISDFFKNPKNQKRGNNVKTHFRGISEVKMPLRFTRFSIISSFLFSKFLKHESILNYIFILNYILSIFLIISCIIPNFLVNLNHF
jgi:hypothetical protein